MGRNREVFMPNLYHVALGWEWSCRNLPRCVVSENNGINDRAIPGKWNVWRNDSV